MKRKVGPRGQIVISKEIRNMLGLGRGASLEFSVSGNVIQIRPEPAPAEFLQRFTEGRGKKPRKRVNWRAILDEEYNVPAGK